MRAHFDSIPRWVLVLLVCIGTATSTASGILLYSAATRNTDKLTVLAEDIKGLLTSGKTTAAQRTKKLQVEVDQLIGQTGNQTALLHDVRYLVSYVLHAQTHQSAAANQFVHLIEVHVDAVITRDTARIVRQVLRSRALSSAGSPTLGP